MERAEILNWLREPDPDRCRDLWRQADAVRATTVGDAVLLRGLIEISNYCTRGCAYCGLRAGRSDLERYRLTGEEILQCARQAVRLGYGTAVLQAGEDPELTAERIEAVVRAIKAETPLAVTLSLGERDEEDLARWRAAGADRYLLRFETSNPQLFHRIHPPAPGKISDRIAILRQLRELGYEVGSGCLIGIPGQSWEDLAGDLLLFRELDLDMIGVGPYIPHPETPLGRLALAGGAAGTSEVPSDPFTTTKVIALARLLCPRANIPSTTALATLDRRSGRELGLQRGANVIMPNLTPAPYRERYEIYPGKACVHETATACRGCLEHRLLSIGRRAGLGRGDALSLTGVQGRQS